MMKIPKPPVPVPVPHRPTLVSSGLMPPWYRRKGPATVVLLVVAYAALWGADWPSSVETSNALGQFAGAEAVLLLTIGLVLVSTLPWVDGWFDGVDRAAIWHRRVALAGMLLLLVHVALAANPEPSVVGPGLAVLGFLGLVVLVVWSVLPRWRSVLPPIAHRAVDGIARRRGVTVVRRIIGGYDRWRGFHRLTGVFVAAGFLHGLLDATTFDSPVLRLSYVVIGGTGVAFYLYREVFARRFMPLHDYQVEYVTSVGDGFVEVGLLPLGRRFDFVPGQFAMVFLEARDGWHRHPFTVASAPTDRTLRFTIKALGDWTGAIGDLLRPGMPAVIAGPLGRFTHRKGTGHQIWVAGGVGVTPFLSWLRSLPEHPVHAEVDFFYTSAEDPVPYADEIMAITAKHDNVRAHIIQSTTDGWLTPEMILGRVTAETKDLSVFLCGPESLVQTMTDGLRKGGVPPARFHREYFDWR